ncbi:cytochrome C assembly family protein [Paenibacillus flagellatus]|uniref:Cytochrome C assembly protein n=1 Tax=Paenibacillus flagellatus TaxID=2211139 RepID=A0A2V5KML2_9BACL|nr:cytochrome c biogenesis protein CcsA [Paenibacillus flagellatus]PYI52207.1 cytochrome C assembly protein [Paenibacillus flagellatus]
MLSNTWIYDAILYIYALSLLFSFSDVATKNRSAKRMGTGLLAFVWLLQSAFIVYRIQEHQYMPVLTMFEALFFYSWVLVAVSLMMNWFLRLDLLVFLVNVAGFAILALNFFSDPSVTPISEQWEARDELVFIHITLAIASYAAFLIAALLSGMYLFMHRKLKGKRWSAVMTRFPSLDKIEGYTYRAVLIGIPLLLSSVALGIAKIALDGDARLLADPKVLSSLFSVAVYAFYLQQRMTAKQPGFMLAFWNLAAFTVVVINFSLFNVYSGFHQWIWM